MAGVLNKTARQFNLKAIVKGRRVLIRLAPGFNVVDDDHWLAFVNKKGKPTVAFVAELVEKGDIEYGEKQDDMELEKDPDTKSKSKSEPLPNNVAFGGDATKPDLDM